MNNASQPLLSRVREQRTVYELGARANPIKITAFLGLYNAAPFFDQIETNVLSQQQEGVHWLIVDNDSSDNSWELAKALGSKLVGPVTLVKNHMNVGGAGSFISSLNLSQGSWMATLHQDDVYYPNHLQEIIKMIDRSSEDVILVTTNMDSLNPGAAKAKRSPRANLLLQNKTNVDVFLAHLRFHALPFPAAAFRITAVEKIPISWHDTSFPDTELVCKLASVGSFGTSSVATMAYRENPVSESHILQDAERRRGQMLGLLRVFGSQEFKIVAHSIGIDLRDDFFNHAAESVELRLGDSEESSLVQRFLADILAIEWGYSAKSVSSHLLAEPDLAEGSFPAGFLRRSIYGIDKIVGVPSNVANFPIIPPRAGGWVQTKIVSPLIKIGLFLVGKSGMRRDLNFQWRRR